MAPLLRVAVAFALGIALADTLQPLPHAPAANAYLGVAAGCALAALLIERLIAHPSLLFHPSHPSHLSRNFHPSLLSHNFRNSQNIRNSRIFRNFRNSQNIRNSVLRLPLLTSLLLLTTVAALGAWRCQRVHDRVAVTWPEGPHDAVAVVRSAPVPRARSTRYLLDIDGHRVYAYASHPSAAYSWGDTLTLRGVVVTPPRNYAVTPHFDYARYLYTHRISGTVMLPSAAVVAVSPAASTSGLHRWREAAVRRLRHLYAAAGLPDDVTAIATALSLGDRRPLDDTLRDAYAEAGASHLLALSGMHVGVLYALLSAMLGLFLTGLWGRRLRGILAAAVLWAFAFLTGFSPSLVRAVTMFTLYALVTAAGGDRTPLNTLALTALLMLGAQPLILFDVGAQLSFAAMLAILLLVPPCHRRLAAALYRHPLLVRLADMAAIAVAAQVGTAPLQLYHFGRLPTWFLVTNLTAVPLIQVVMVLLVAWLLLSLLLSLLPVGTSGTTWSAPLAAALAAALAAVADAVAHALTAAVRLMNSLLTTIARWPASTIRIAPFDAIDAALMTLLSFFLYRYLLKKHTPSALWALGCVAFWLLRRLSDVVFASVA